MRDKTKSKQYNKTYYEKNKEQLKSKANEYYRDNKEKVLENVAEYREKNRDMLREKDKEYARRKPELRMLYRAARRAKEKGLEFNLTEGDIIIPEKCPLLEVKLEYCYDLEEVKGKRDLSASPSLDRKDSTKGYTKDNVWVISYKANSMKSNATIDEIEMLLKNLREEL